MNRNKHCIIIAGPTAVGKTALAVQVAQHFSTQIISADSRQCFKELDIGVAKPSAAELQLVEHYFISSHSVQEEVNAAIFEQYALEKAAEIFEKNDIAVIVGGTGLYIKAFCEGMDEIPAIDAAVRKKIIDDYNQYGLEWLREAVRANDPVYFAEGEIQNPQRMMRALEVKFGTGRSVVEYRSQNKKKRSFNIIKIGLELPREELVKRINRRVDLMMEAGLQDEVKDLQAYKHLNALQTVGYREFFDYFAGHYTFDGAVEAIKINTRQYAKRQMTWFKKDSEITWYPPVVEEVLTQTEKRILQG
ncbi:MAG: tRNA (adenosine(37)-N6)-dimethylallyltransferase MiaA [Ferruginibacter sp.]